MSGLMIASMTRARLRGFAAAFATAAQLFLGAVPLAEVRLSRDESAHLEGAGLRLHHAHNEASCAACVSQHILSTAEPGRIARIAIIATAPHLTTSAFRVNSGTQWFFSRSRAPPASPV